MFDILEGDFSVIDLPEVSSSFVTGFEGFPITAKGLRNLISFNKKAKEGRSYQDRM